jgi:hypothetical protein
MGERSNREAPQERAYRRLGAAVILSAVRDLEKPTRAGRESGPAGVSAREFLSVANSSLTFWCRVADVDMNVILRTIARGSCQSGKGSIGNRRRTGQEGSEPAL